MKRGLTEADRGVTWEIDSGCLGTAAPSANDVPQQWNSVKRGVTEADMGVTQDIDSGWESGDCCTVS